MFIQNLSILARAPWKKININHLGLLSLISLFLMYSTASFFYNGALGLTATQAMARHNAKRNPVNSLFGVRGARSYISPQEREEYKLYLNYGSPQWLEGGAGPEDFQFFDEWKEHKVFKLTLSDLEELN